MRSFFCDSENKLNTATISDLDQIFRQEVLDISEEYRTRILTDLRKYYARVNYAEYGKRIGEMLCLCNLVLVSIINPF